MNGLETNPKSFLNGFEQNEGLPPYMSTNANQILRVNPLATGVEWSDEITQNGFKADTGDGSTNTNDIFEGFIFNNNVKTGLFNYGSTNETLGLRINNAPIIEMETSIIKPQQNIQLVNDSILTSARIGFGGSDTFITGDNATAINKKIVFSVDSQEKLRITNNTQDQIKTRAPLNFDISTFGTTTPMMYNGNYNGNCVGLNLNNTNRRVDVCCNGVVSSRFIDDQVQMFRPLYLDNPTMPRVIVYNGGNTTIQANCTGANTLYMKRNATSGNDTVLIFPQPSSGFSPLYTIITDGDGNSSTSVCKVETSAGDVLTLINGARTLLLSPVSTTLVLNACYSFQWVPSDSRWVLIRLA